PEFQKFHFSIISFQPPEPNKHHNSSENLYFQKTQDTTYSTQNKTRHVRSQGSTSRKLNKKPFSFHNTQHNHPIKTSRISSTNQLHYRHHPLFFLKNKKPHNPNCYSTPETQSKQ
ncbi:hypothetical protein V8G54_031652, partial [Vigna mungo]